MEPVVFLDPINIPQASTKSQEKHGQKSSDNGKKKATASQTKSKPSDKKPKKGARPLFVLPSLTRNKKK